MFWEQRSSKKRFLMPRSSLEKQEWLQLQVTTCGLSCQVRKVPAALRAGPNMQDMVRKSFPVSQWGGPSCAWVLCKAE